MAQEGAPNPQRQSYIRAPLSQYEPQSSADDSSGESSDDRPDSRRETTHLRRESTTLDPASYGMSSLRRLFCWVVRGDRNANNLNCPSFARQESSLEL